MITDLELASITGLSDADGRDRLNARAPTPRDGPVYLTYLSLGAMAAPFGLNVAGTLRSGLLAWAAGRDLSGLNPALPNPGALAALHARLDGSPGINLADAKGPALLTLFAAGVNAGGINLAPLLTAPQAAELLALGWDVPAPVTAADVSAARNAARVAALKRSLIDRADAGRLAAVALLDAWHRAALADPATPDPTPADLAAAFAAAPTT